MRPCHHRYMSVDPGGRPAFDPDKANEVLGKRVLIGLTYVRPDGTVDRHEQLVGVIVRADEQMVAMQVDGREDLFTLPPDLRGFFPADPGEYRLKSTGQVVVDPDYLTTWTIDMPSSK